jgi:uncharacterized membrane protein
MLVIVLLLGDQWTHREWDKVPLISRLLQLFLPWVPLLLLCLYKLLYPVSAPFKFILGILAFFALVVTGINIYRSLWSALVNLQSRHPKMGGGQLLLLISVVIVYTITAIVSLFSVAYAIVSYLDGPSGGNYIMDSDHGQYRLEAWDLRTFFYFSSVTYFSLGYGDYLPRGTVMIAFVYLESLLGYINSGIMIAYAFNLFTKLNR